VAGVVGTVADLLEVPPGMERAIEAVLGERLQWVVVERFEHARAAVAYLQERSLGAATFLPLEHLPVPTGPLPDQNGVSWVALSVGAPSLSLVHYLLGQVVIVDHLDQAEPLWRQEGAETVATLRQLEQRVALAREAEATHEAQMARLREAIEAAQTRETELVAETTGCRVNLASTTERVEALGRELTRIDDIERDL